MILTPVPDAVADAVAAVVALVLWVSGPSSSFSWHPLRRPHPPPCCCWTMNPVPPMGGGNIWAWPCFVTKDGIGGIVGAIGVCKMDPVPASESYWLHTAGVVHDQMPCLSALIALIANDIERPASMYGFQSVRHWNSDSKQRYRSGQSPILGQMRTFV